MRLFLFVNTITGGHHVVVMVKPLLHYLNLLILLAIPSLLLGQVKRAGIIAGPTVSNIGNTKLIANSPRLGNYFGAYANFYLAENSMLKVAVIKTRKGFIVDNQELHRLNYINIPIAYAHDIGYKFYLVSGIDIGLRRPTDNKYAIEARNLDIGLNVGFQYAISNSFGIECLFTHGLIPVFEYQQTDLYGNKLGIEKFGLNRCLQLGFYLNFIKTKKTAHST